MDTRQTCQARKQFMPRRRPQNGEPKIKVQPTFLDAGIVLRCLRILPLSLSLGLVNTAPNCRLNFSPMSTPGAKAALKHYYDCFASPFATC